MMGCMPAAGRVAGQTRNETGNGARDEARSWARGSARNAGGFLSTATPDLDEVVETDAVVSPYTPWITLVWNDPVNLMTYVTFVFQSYFGYPREKAEKLMMDVHVEGRAVVSNGSREAMERDAEALQGFGLWATFQKDD